ncbi:3-deoxy-7-phosphoheptulonate synthase [Micromonospora antibiotica]|uniref:Phospho-2-dehydro-3-deoxyheptonate aldolase n=1 Tax=Micromonospora antibiotica TaxID=2807623 RepID=A0ABS3V298_9ACTN|nr:3-deoxy-7-phosphoheptulonate synthase [Micromonospora antibiotica]MBO4159736.1 3-deoxy-7-phosphoheptulonate synthase [Micromonospora antibiotica]
MTEKAFRYDVLADDEIRVPDGLRDVWRGFKEPPHQQPVWRNRHLLEWARATLAWSAPLVTSPEVEELSRLLAEVADGRRRVLQCGDCVEDPREATATHVRDRIRLIDELAALMTAGSGLPVLRVGRLAGQLAKPRSEPFERVNGVDLPAFRGALVNRPGHTMADRSPDPVRLYHGYRMSRTVLAHLELLGRHPGQAGVDPVWTSHEALLLDYEIPLLRRAPGGSSLLTSTHWPWIGERTRRHDGAHVQVMAAIDNPVACKVGPGISAGELLELCAKLDPQRRPGRLTLIARLGAGRVTDTLPPLVRAVRRAGHPAIWLCDPMHGNTIRSPSGRKTRSVADVVAEVERFQLAVLAGEGVPGGLHLETTPNTVAECVPVAGNEPVGPFTTLCDPRLNGDQAARVVSAWHA